MSKRFLYIKGYHWPHIAVFTLTPLAAMGGLIWVYQNGGPHWATWILAIFMAILTGFGVTGGYHRLFSHKSYQAKGPLKIFFLIFGGAAFQGSVRWWACEHRIHHRFEDEDQDPYGINKGFWYAHIGWLLGDKHDPESFDNVKDLDQDPWIRLQHRYYFPLSIFFGLIFPALLAASWGDLWGGLFLAGFARMVFTHHSTFCINSLCHFIGKQTYSDRLTARDSWVASLATFGEGYHNFHHVFQYDYRNGIRAYHWDPTKWLIRLFAGMGLASHLKTAPRERILFAKLQMDQKRAATRLTHYSETARLKVQELLAATFDQIQKAHARFLELKQQYGELKQSKLGTPTLNELPAELRRARREFKTAMAHWRSLIKGAHWVGV